MTKAKFTVPTSTNKEVEVTLPHYRASKSSAYKVIDENKAIQVQVLPNDTQIKETYSSLAFLYSDNEITEKEFFDKYAEAISIFDSKVRV